MAKRPGDQFEARPILNGIRFKLTRQNPETGDPRYAEVDVMQDEIDKLLKGGMGSSATDVMEFVGKEAAERLALTLDFTAEWKG